MVFVVPGRIVEPVVEPQVEMVTSVMFQSHSTTLLIGSAPAPCGTPIFSRDPIEKGLYTLEQQRVMAMALGWPRSSSLPRKYPVESIVTPPSLLWTLVTGI